MKRPYSIHVFSLICAGLVTFVFMSCEENDLDRIHVTPQQRPTVNSIEPAMGYAGDEVTILGTNFDPQVQDNAVFFNSLPAKIISVTPTTLKVQVPEGATSGPIQVKVINFSVSSTNDFGVINTLVVPLSDGDDDVEEVAVLDSDPDDGVEVGTMDLTSSDLELGEISSGQGLMNIGIRYQKVNIPQGAAITEAYIQFNTDDEGSDPVELTIYGENVGNAAPYTEDLGNLSSRALTAAQVVWEIPEWVSAGDRGDAQRTVNIASIIQEIVARSDWESGNSLNIIMKPTGASLGMTSSSGGREAEDYSSSDASHGAELTVVFH